MVNLHILVLYFALLAYSIGSTAAAIAVRLAGVNRPSNAGRLEVRYNGVWGTVCDDLFDHNDARVFCRMLGFTTAGYYIGNRYGSGSGQIWLDNVKCTGNERSIVECQHNGWGVENCGHNEDVSISCGKSIIVLEIGDGNRVMLAGTSITFTCNWLSTPAYWHFYSLTSGSAPCSFNSYQRHPGISPCPSAARISLANSYNSRRNKTTLTITKAQLSDAGTYTCGSRNPYSLSTAHSVIVGVIASYPIIKRTVTDNCILEGQNVSLTCQVTYNGTNLMPLVMSWYTYPWYFGSYRYDIVYEGRRNTTNSSSVHQSSLTFTATTTDIKYACKVSFFSPTGIVVPGVQKQSSYTYSSFWSSPFVSSTAANCSSEIEFTVNGGSSVDSEVSVTVGDVITCSAEGALSYRWTNSGDEETYGKTLSISQPGSFNYECSVFVECGTGAICPFTKNISGFAREFITTTRSTTTQTSAIVAGVQDDDTSTSYQSATITLAVLLFIILVGVIAVVAFLLYRRAGISFCSELCVRSSSEEEETNTNELEESPNIENMYVNAIALAAAKDDTTDEDGEKSQAVYQDLNVGAESAEPVFYETIKVKPRALPRPAPRDESNA